MTMGRQYSLSFNEKRQVWLASYRSVDGTWKTKWIPVTYGRNHRLDAEHWFIEWYAEYLRTGGVQPANQRVQAAAKTLRTMSARWLALRYEDPGTKPNTYRGFHFSMKNWILDNAEFPHEKVEHLDLEREFTVPLCRAWIQSVRGS